MSAIAEWHILPTIRIDELTAICQPTRRSLFRSPVRDYEAFWTFLSTHATQGDGLDASGWVMNPLLPFLEERFDVPVTAAEQHPLAKAIGIETFFVIEAGLATRWRDGLSGAIADRDGLSGYLLEWYGEDAAPGAADIEPHVRGLAYLQAGLAKLTSDFILLLSIG